MSLEIRRAIKRVGDVVLAATFLFITAPLICVVALAIWVEDGRPIIFTQDRVGRGRRKFTCYKFRSMRPGAEERGLGGQVARDDDRVTIVGRFLRAWTLDELPQLWNVLRGDMSIVGPRAWIVRQAERCTGEAARRFEARPGLAGWAWIHGRNLVPWPERIRLDLWYVDNWSLRLDLYILARAVLLLFRRHGVYGVDGLATDQALLAVGAELNADGSEPQMLLAPDESRPVALKPNEDQSKDVVDIRPT